MKAKKIIIILIIINILLIGVIYNFIEKDYLDNEKIIVKAMTKTEYENSVKSLNKSHDEFVHYIEGCKTKIASAITDMGVTTSREANLETMASNIRNIARDASSISYNNSASKLTSTNVQGAVDELNKNFDVKMFDIPSSITDYPLTMFKIGNIGMLNCNVQVNKEITWGTVALAEIPQELETEGWFFGYTDNGLVQIGDGEVVLKPYNESLAPGSWMNILLIYPIIQ